MLEADEVDADFFTPSTSTSLANIFKKPSSVDEENENTSLKYVPKLPTKELMKAEETKPTLCIFACALNAYEWLENNYVSRGKLGFAIIKVIKSGIHNIVLYDSKKTTISNATLTPNLKMDIKDNISISYYDNLHKYWSIQATEIELHKIIEIATSLGVLLKYNQNEEHQSDNTVVMSNDEQNFLIKQEDEASDTDTIANKRTKDAILRRMANMGQSVLPSTVTISKHLSDSSDSNDSTVNDIKLKQKHFKTSNNRSNLEKHLVKRNVDGIMVETVPNEVSHRNLYEGNNQMVPFTSTNVVSEIPNDVSGSSRNDMAIIISEQRVSNSELRINVNRISDKLDSVLDKLKDRPAVVSDSSAEFQNILVQKLMNEYETKIKMYEEIIKSNGLNCNYLENKVKTAVDKDHLLEEKKEELENIIKEKDSIISTLKEELETLNKQYQSNLEKENEYKKVVSQLNEDIADKTDQINYLKTLNETADNFQKSDDAKNKIKNIMNDTFQIISSQFVNEENYSGATVKNIVAVVIKKTTKEGISNM